MPRRSAVTHPERITEADHDREAKAGEDERDEHLGSENSERVPVKQPNDPSRVDLPEFDQDRGSEEVRERTRRGRR
jgi:hypothetical protein